MLFKIILFYLTLEEVLPYFNNVVLKGDFIKIVLDQIDRNSVIDFLEQDYKDFIETYYLLGLTREDIIIEDHLYSLIITKFLMRIKNEDVLKLLYSNDVDNIPEYPELKKLLLKIISENSDKIPENELNKIIDEYPLLDNILKLNPKLKNLDLCYSMFNEDIDEPANTLGVGTLNGV